MKIHLSISEMYLYYYNEMRGVTLGKTVTFYIYVIFTIRSFKMLKGLYVMSPNVFENVYSQESQEKIAEYCEILAPVMSKGELLENTELLKEVEVLFSSWGAPLFDETLLDAAPNLKVVFYGAGTLKHVLTDAFWQRDIQVTTANVSTLR